MTDDVIIRRLTIIKQLYKQGIEQANLPESASYTAVLSLHDSIDMFMNLAATKKGIGTGQFLMQYFDSIPELTLKSSVNKINQRRNSLKHNSIIPGKIEIQDSCSVAKIFFEENVRTIFAKDFDSISLFSLISYEKVRNFLVAGNAFLEENKLKDAGEEVAKAYFHLLLIEESLSKSKVNNPWYSSEPQSRYDYDKGKFYTKGMESFFEGQEKMMKEEKTKDGYVEISEGVASIAYNYNKAFSYIFQSLQIFSLGLDYRKYNFYVSFMPQAFRYNPIEEEYEIGIPLKGKELLTRDNIGFAIEFVLEFALKLQEFKY